MPPQRGQLRGVVGGYDIHRLPITVSPLPGESAESWIIALADRYRVTPAKLFQTLGIALPSKAPGRVLDHISAHRDQLASAAGLAGNQIDDLLAPTALDHAVAQYVDRYRASTCRPAPAAKFCPSCLRENGGRWEASWSNPVHIICQHHRVHLRDRCPSCGQRHWASPCWVTSARSGRWCPEYTIRAHKPVPRQLRARCGQNLGAIDPAPLVSDELLGAQQLLFDLAEQAITNPRAIRLCCGIGVGPASYFNAVMELIDEAKGFHVHAPVPGAAQHISPLAAAMTIAVSITRQPRRVDAAVLAERHRLMNPLGRHTPITLHGLRRGTHHPVLVAARLSTLAPHMSQADQLTFAITATLPRPPPGYRSEHDQPDTHPPTQDELRYAWLPQQLWPGPLSDTITDAGSFPRTAAVMALAKLGSARTWTEIATGLALPAAITDHTRGFLHRIRRTGRWPTLLRQLTALAQTLQRDPPPINYAARRDIDPDTLTASIRTARQQLRHQLPADRLELLARHFWQLYTGSDIRFAPPALTPATSNEQQHRNQVIEPGAADDDILHTAFNLIQHNTPADSGPLTWQPAPPPTPNRAADHHSDIADADKQA